MFNHIRANLWLLFLTLIVCSGLYPLALWAIGRLPFFRDESPGSLIVASDGKVIGSRLIAQPFTSDEFFQPRPSAASYNAMASSGSNWSASNYLLRDRVARALGPIVRYGKGADKIGKKPGDGVQQDIESWFAKDSYQNQPGIIMQWLGLHPGLAEAWIKSTGDAVKDQWKGAGKVIESNEAFVRQWQADFPELFIAWAQSKPYRDWQEQNPEKTIPPTTELAKMFFRSFATKHPGEWPVSEDYETPEKQQRKRLARVRQGNEVLSVFFDMWRQDNADVPLEPVPADMVMASGSGLDPHITLQNARYQLKYRRIASAQADKLVADRAARNMKAKGLDLQSLAEPQRQQLLRNERKTIEGKLGRFLEETIRQEIAMILEEKKEAPLGGLAGVPLLNVLELNIELQKRMETSSYAIGECLLMDVGQ